MTPAVETSAHSAVATPRSLLIPAEQTAALYRNTPMVLAGNLLMSSLLVYILPPAVPLHIKVLWLAAIVVQCVARVILWFAYRRMTPPPRSAHRWATWSMLGSAVSGTLWGIGAIALFVPDQIDFQLLLLFILVGMGSSAVYSLTPYLPAFYAFLLPSIVPAGIVFAFQGDTLHVVLAIMIVIYVAVTAIFARNMHKLLFDSLNLRFENIDLVEDLKLRKEEADSANIAKSRFLAAASHDLRQPMHALSLLTGGLREEVSSHPRALRLVEKIQDSFDAMDSLFNALLEVSKLDAGVIEKQVRDLFVQPALQRLQVIFTPLALERGLRFSMVASSACVRSDPALLDRILQNLVSNAIKYTHSGGLVIGCRRRACTLSIEVWDSGVGIAPGHQEEIFQEFFQLENPERDRSKGLGLGLAIVKRVSRLLDHPIQVRSTPGRGSMFAVEVPYGDAAAAVAEPEAIESVANFFAGVRVAVVDDELAIIDAMTGLLERWGCIVICAKSEAELLDKLRNERIVPDLLISDYRLSGTRHGVSVIESVQQAIGRRIPSILITGDTAPDRLKEAHASGFELLHKPVAPAKLRHVMQRLLSPGSHRDRTGSP